MGSVWGHAGNVWSQASRTHERLSLDYMPGAVLGSVGLEIILSDSIGQAGPVEFWGRSLTQAGVFLRVWGLHDFSKLLLFPCQNPQTDRLSLAGLPPKDGSRERKRPVSMSPGGVGLRGSPAHEAGLGSPRVCPFVPPSAPWR